MAPAKLGLIFTLALVSLGTTAAPVADNNTPEGLALAAAAGGHGVKRGYDGDWLYSREDASANNPIGKVTVSGEGLTPEKKRGYDGDWLYSRKTAAEARPVNAN
ncbi:hypothetical protein BDZ91DRAFT_801221 [Kalaharituber pfeilii]|nr:hypothetical protein BDZ91DRAFT_801221 [Kalaharituber pfeilii]